MLEKGKLLLKNFIIGDRTVYDVKISDPWDEKDFVVVNGTSEGRFERILPYPLFI